MNRLSGSRLTRAVALAALGVALSSPASAITLFPHVRVPQRSTFNTDVQLQGLYDEMSEVYVPAMSAEDVHLFDEVVYTPHFLLIDASGRKLTQEQMRARAAETPAPDSLEQRIDALTPVPGGVTARVTVISVRSFVDTAGRDGAPGMSHTTTEVTPYSDSWVRTTDGWKMKSREQTGPTRTILDQPEWGM